MPIGMEGFLFLSLTFYLLDRVVLIKVKGDHIPERETFLSVQPH
jgi:hypothetical protein